MFDTIVVRRDSGVAKAMDRQTEAIRDLAHATREAAYRRVVAWVQHAEARCLVCHEPWREGLRSQKDNRELLLFHPCGQTVRISETLLWMYPPGENPHVQKLQEEACYLAEWWDVVQVACDQANRPIRGIRVEPVSLYRTPECEYYRGKEVLA